jgi:dTDP-L-rhamnose 4-epimerase
LETVFRKELGGRVLITGGRKQDPVITGRYRSGDVRHIVADPARATDVLGFQAAVDPRRGLPDLAFGPLRG